MGDIRSIEQAIQALAPAELAELRRWLAEFGAQAWDRQVPQDATSGKLDDLVTQALVLPPEDRARLAQDVLASLDGSPSAEVDAAWDAEIHRRLAEVESGKAVLTPAEEVFAKVRKSLG
jgi:putative addiction module component (TIGR02574 family)